MPEARCLRSLGASLCLAFLTVAPGGSPGAAASGRLGAVDGAMILRYRWLRGDREQNADTAVRSRKTGSILRMPHPRFALATMSLSGEWGVELLSGFRQEFSRTATGLATRTIRPFCAEKSPPGRLEARPQATVRWTAHTLFRRVRRERSFQRTATVQKTKSDRDELRAPQRQTAIGGRIAAHALAAVGQAYVWGGESPQTGFDCSGLVQYVLSAVGITVPRTSFAQYQVGSAVSLNALQPGDLLFFATYGTGPSHVGIYIGAGRFVNALNSSTGVIISSLRDPYFSSRLLGARSPWSASSSSTGA